MTRDERRPVRQPSDSDLCPETCENPRCQKAFYITAAQCPLCHASYDTIECYTDDVRRHIEVYLSQHQKGVSGVPVLRTSGANNGTDKVSRDKRKRSRSTTPPGPVGARGAPTSQSHSSGTRVVQPSTSSNSLANRLLRTSSADEGDMPDLDSSDEEDEEGDGRAGSAAQRGLSDSEDEAVNPHWMRIYLPARMRTGDLQMRSKHLAFMEARVVRGTSGGHRKAFEVWLDFLRKEGVLSGSTADPSTFLLESIPSKED